MPYFNIIKTQLEGSRARTCGKVELNGRWYVRLTLELRDGSTGEVRFSVTMPEYDGGKTFKENLVNGLENPKLTVVYMDTGGTVSAFLKLDVLSTVDELVKLKDTHKKELFKYLMEIYRCTVETDLPWDKCQKPDGKKEVSDMLTYQMDLALKSM